MGFSGVFGFGFAERKIRNRRLVRKIIKNRGIYSNFTFILYHYFYLTVPSLDRDLDEKTRPITKYHSIEN